MASGSVAASMTGAAAMSVAKFTAAALGGSSGLFASGVQSLVNCGNAGLLALGQRRSKKPPDDQHPFGYGMELYFWSLLVAVVLFAVAGGATAARGVAKVLDPKPLTGVGWSYGVLAVSAAFAVRAWRVAFKEFRAGQGDRPFWRAVRKAKDPTTLTTLFEGSASLFGLAVAFLGLLLAHRLDAPVIDGAASVVIGLLMAGVATGLVYQGKQLLVGESATAGLKDALRTTVERDAAVDRVEELLTMHLATDDMLMTAVVRFRGDLSGGDVADAVARLIRGVRSAHPEVKRAFVQPASAGEQTHAA
jgi:cation diffusion facilitator family transporter